MIALLACSVANAQGRGGGGRGNKGGGPPPSTSDGPPTGSDSRPKAEAPAKIEIVGVITAIDPQSDRVTIAYEAVEALTLPQGVRPFVVAKSALLKDRKVGEKVRFSLESQQIATLRPFDQAQAGDDAPGPAAKPVQR
jgi:Cu/Ag efflux protein CusF